MFGLSCGRKGELGTVPEEDVEPEAAAAAWYAVCEGNGTCG